MDDDGVRRRRADRRTIFARVSPEQKARMVTALRGQGRAVGFLGDGVNDALALHAADVGISVDTATDVAKDAADVILLEKDLGVLADGVMAGRRIFANTIKYVLMGTSSNFGNMFSAAAASAVLPFLPMLPSQILLNNLLYDSGQLTIPTDHVDPEQLHAPSHWDIASIRRFMLFFGPISSLFDFLTFALMLGVFHASAGEFRAGWFAESLATQTLVIFAIRTRRSPFTRSRPSRPLLIACLGDGRRRRRPAAVTAGRGPRLHSPAGGVLPRAHRDGRRLPRADRGGEAAVLRLCPRPVSPHAARARPPAPAAAAGGPVQRAGPAGVLSGRRRTGQGPGPDAPGASGPGPLFDVRARC